jgi:hypothetical protein
MTKWEHTYVLIEPSDDPCTEINKLGQEGWEAFAVTPENKDNHGVIFLKRPVPVAPLDFGPKLPKCTQCGKQYAGRACPCVDGLCPRDGGPCEAAGDGARCCGEGQTF